MISLREEPQSEACAPASNALHSTGSASCGAWIPPGGRAITDTPQQPLEQAAAREPEQHADVLRVQLGDREILLVGTAHVSQESTELVRDVITREEPDHVCVELDAQRYEALNNANRWQSLDLKQLIRNKQLTTLLVNLMLVSYQRKLGKQLGVPPGTELLEAVRSAEARDIPFSLCDRNIRITMLRAWRSMSIWQKWKLLASLLASLFTGDELTEDDLRELRQHDVLSEMMNELAQAMPTLKRVLIDERDTYLAQRIREAEGKKVVAVVGAGHVEGIKRTLLEETDQDLTEIDTVPSTLPIWKWVGWAIPALIVGALGWIAWTKGTDVAGESLTFWIMINGIPCGIGAIIALAHPATILAAFLAAPITSLSPLIGAGYVTAFVQAYMRPPLVRDFESVVDDFSSPREWWRNRLLRVLTAFILPTVGSLIGTYVGGAEILSKLF